MPRSLLNFSPADCITCNSVLGWKYEVAYEESQKYKEGKYILEKVRRRMVVRGVVG